MNLKRALNKMSSIIVNGYLYKKCDYSNNDEIIFFISDSGEKYTCISKGSKKITSKNSRNLIIGSYTEFDFFQARNINKVSLLKKAFILVNIDWDIQFDKNFNLLNKSVEIINDKCVFNFYKNCLFLIKEKKYRSIEISLIIISKLFPLIGIDMQIDKCVICSSKIIKTLSISEHGFICSNCLKKNERMFNVNFLKLIYYLLKNKYDEIKNYSQYYNLCFDVLCEYIELNTGLSINYNN